MANHNNRSLNPHSDPSGRLARCLQRPTVSPDGYFLAVVTPELELRVINLLGAAAGTLVSKVMQFPSSLKNFWQNVEIIRWSPEQIYRSNSGGSVNGHDRADFGQTWLLIASGQRFLVLQLDLSSEASVDVDYKSSVLCDMEFPEYYGKITVADFVCSHDYALLLFDMNLHGSLLSLTKSERHDIKGVKFSTDQGLAKDPTGRYFALLRRENSQDQVSIFDLRQNTTNPVTFSMGLNDVQGMRWSPDGKPVLLVWESAAYGTKIRFFTALGHSIQLLDLTWGISQTDSSLADVSGPGVTALAWSRQGGSSTNTVLAVGDGSKQIAIRCQKTESLSLDRVTIAAHPESVTSTDCTIWQEQADNQFYSESGLVEIHSDANQDVEIVSISADGSMFASKLASAPRTLWIWQAGQTKPSFVVFFRDDIKQLLWHPSLAGVLIAIPKNKSSMVHAWYDKDKSPVTGLIPINDASPTGSWKGSWVGQQNSKQVKQHLFLLSSTKHFQIGHLGVANGQLCFESIFDQNHSDEGDSIAMFDTPSKPGRKEHEVMFNAHMPSKTDPDTFWFSDR